MVQVSWLTGYAVNTEMCRGKRFFVATNCASLIVTHTRYYDEYERDYPRQEKNSSFYVAYSTR